MKADLIVKNARIYTVNEKQPWAEAVAVKDGKFVYVGSNEGLAAYEGDIVIDAQGKFITPALLDCHVHIAWSTMSTRIFSGDLSLLEGNGKAEILANLEKYVKENPEKDSYFIFLEAGNLNGDRLTRDDLDEIVPEKKLHIQEVECHSSWYNTPMMRAVGLDDYEEDIAPGLSYFERDEDGRINGRIFEFCQFVANAKPMTDEEFSGGLDYIIDYWKKVGVVAAFDAGIMGGNNEENFCRVAAEKDKAGQLPIYVEGCTYIFDPRQLDSVVEKLNKYKELYSTEHFMPRIAKMMFDGTIIGKTGALYEPYAATDSNGGTLVTAEELCSFLIALNENGTDFHVHTVGERAIGTVLDAVEMARKEVGEAFRIQVTCAHIETIPDEMLPRFAELGVFGNFTPHWFGGNTIGNIEIMEDFIGVKRAHRMYRGNSLWNTGATVTFACDTIAFSEDMRNWSPYMGMEVGITRQDDTLFGAIEDDYSGCPVYPGNEERLTLAQMLRGYTLNAARQMRLDDKIGSIEAGKDGSFLIFENNLFDVDVYELHRQLPEDVFFKGEKVN